MRTSPKARVTISASEATAIASVRRLIGGGAASSWTVGSGDASCGGASASFTGAGLYSESVSIPCVLFSTTAAMPLHEKKVVAVLPAYNAEKTLRATYDD